MLLTEIQ